MKNIPYFQVLGSLLYFVNCTRPIKIRGKLDINHWVVLIWILSTIEIWYSLVRHNLGQTTPKYYHGYQTHHKDESMKIVEDNDSSRSSSSFLFTFAIGAIAWRMRKQANEIEYIATTLIIKGLWLLYINQEWDILQIYKFKLWRDNQSCMKT